CMLFFFFSSRRRHTRSKRDWSSDVCSSDLPPHCAPARPGRDAGRGRGRHRAGAFRGRWVMATAVAALRGGDTPFIVGGRTFQSRLMVGTGKYPDNDTMTRAIEASGAEIVTVAVRRVNLDRPRDDSLPHHP